jgi:phenylacetate-CoA ligase
MMRSALYGLALRTVLWVLWLVRRLISLDGRTYALMNLGKLQWFLTKVGRLGAHAAYLKARSTCPAYQDFLTKMGHQEKGPWRLEALPEMTKENYVQKYSIEQRCYGGAIPKAGVVIDESSGSTGMPNNWVRSAAERADVKRILQLNYQLIYRDSGCILLNCFALGPWATGMNVSMSLVEMGILKSIGPDRQKLENTLIFFGSGYRYLIFGYPPFIRAFVDETRLDLSQYQFDLVVGGEGISEGLRSHLRQYARTVISSFGASDLEINIAVETELTIALRGLCLKNEILCQHLFGRATLPMIFQYNALDYTIETNGENELLFTLARLSGAAPKIRYNLRDSGGVFSFSSLSRALEKHGVLLAALAKRYSCLPLLFVYGRNDATVPFYGAKIYPADLERIINEDSVLAMEIHSFQLKVVEDELLTHQLEIHLELTKSRGDGRPSEIDKLQETIFDGLVRVNQDFREVTKMFHRGQVQVFLHEHEKGPFAGRDIRIKNKYIA